MGAFDDVIYYFPFDDEGNVDLYFIEVDSATDVAQFTREAYPNFFGDDGEVNISDENFVSNGQFLLHQNIKADDPADDDKITESITDIAYGDWTIERDGSNSANFLRFHRFPSFLANPEKNPRYAVEVESTGADGTFIDLRIKWQNVNRFAEDGQSYTFSFVGETVGVASLDIDVYLIKNFGTGGSAETEEKLNDTPINLDETYAQKVITFEC